MAEAALDSSIVIGLHFRNAGEKAACAACVPQGYTPTVSAYVIFEVAKGFLRSLIVLHNTSFEFKTYGDMTEAAHSGQLRFRQYEMQSRLGAFDDFWKEMVAADGALKPSQILAEFRARLRIWVRRGWRSMTSQARAENRVGCQELRPPFQQGHDKLLNQKVPSQLCGIPEACGLDRYIQAHKESLAALGTSLAAGGSRRIDREVTRRVIALLRLSGKAPAAAFKGKDCWACGDAFICHEAAEGAVLVSKNARHFEPICTALNKVFVSQGISVV